MIAHYEDTRRNTFFSQLINLKQKGSVTKHIENFQRLTPQPTRLTPQPTRLTPQQLEERKEKGLCFNCDSKYSKGHKCGEKKLFYIDCEEEEEQEQEPSRTDSH
jgi:hypothetical protein